MFNPTTRNINAISIVISIFIVLIINSFVLNHKKMSFDVSFNSSNIQQANVSSENTNLAVTPEDEKNSKSNPDWIIKIPEINLSAEIAQGTSSDIMSKYVGHFEETQTEYGNIGLAAHNRGYPVNYFQDLKKLQEGSEIIYKHENFEMVYEVKIMEIIENTNWDYLENTEDNRITLITCVENEPKYRRCIQGVEKIESEEY